MIFTDETKDAPTEAIYYKDMPNGYTFTAKETLSHARKESGNRNAWPFEELNQVLKYVDDFADRVAWF